MFIQNVAESFIEDDVETSQSSQESDYALDSDDEGHTNINDTKTATLQGMYAVSLKLRNNLRDHSSSWYENWPPFASDINVDNVNKLVSPLLFNFMAWLLGFSDDPESTGYIALDEKTTAKIFSLCQDMVYVASKGKVQTPKSLAWAIAVHQMSGCSGLRLFRSHKHFKWIWTFCITAHNYGI